MSIKVINEDRLFRMLPSFVSSADRIFIELAQNAQRAGATRLDITIKDGVLTAVDNGNGVSSALPLFVLAESNWDDVVEEHQKPAGWGMFLLYTLSEIVTYRSNFGSVAVDCKQFLSDAAYRQKILSGSTVDPQSKLNGFYVSAVLRQGVEDRIFRSHGLTSYQLRYFPLDITVNGAAVPRASKPSGKLELDYMGNKVYIKHPDHISGMDSLMDSLTVIWYGQEIMNTSYSTNVILDVTTGSPVTPVLPFRNTIAADEKFVAFYEFIRKAVVEYCIKEINNTDTTLYEMRSLAECMANIATQDELDRLTRYYYEIAEPYFDSPYISSISSIYLLEQKDALPMSDHVDVWIDNKRVEDLSDMVLPPNTVREVVVQQRRPSWVPDPVSRKRVIRIERGESHRRYCGAFDEFCQAEIAFDDGSRIPIMAVGSTIYYSDKNALEESVDFRSAVFEHRIYDENCGDSWETQENYFESDWEEIVASLTDTHSRQRLFGNIADAARVSVGDIVAIQITGNTAILTVKSTNGEKQIKINLK